MKILKNFRSLLNRILHTTGARNKPMPHLVHVSPEAESNIKKSIPFFERIKGIHTGRRGFVIGNGPSLRIGDLDLLNEDVTIASNKIYLAFDHVKWRPTYYTVADDLVWGKIQEKIPSEILDVLIPHYLNPSPLKKCQTWRTLRFAGIEAENNPRFKGIDFSKNASNGLFGSCTVTYENLQLAVHLGLNPIYIIGCDHFYKGENQVVKDQALPHGNFSNHFIEGYRLPGELVNPAPLDIMNRGYREARKFSDSTDIKIYNATRGGNLEHFIRADFESLFSKK
jgi:hypothetical protein